MAKQSTPQSDELRYLSTSTIFMVNVEDWQNASLAIVSTVEEGRLWYMVSYTNTTLLWHPRFDTSTQKWNRLNLPLSLQFLIVEIPVAIYISTSFYVYIISIYVGKLVVT